MKIGTDGAKALFNVEAANRESVRAVGELILKILGSAHCDEATKVSAINAVSRVCQATMNISNCTFSGPV